MLIRNRGFVIGSLFVGMLAGACASNSEGPEPLTQPTEGHAFLTIVGDKNVFLAAGAHQTVTVRYHDDADAPLAGEINFTVDGTANGGTISAMSGVTDSNGQVSLDIIGGPSGQAAFNVDAAAQYATSVNWAVSVGAGSGPPTAYNLVGTYNVESQFNMVSGLPGTVGDIVNTFIDMTDGPNDPATWLIDLLVSQNASVASFVGNFRPLLDAFVNSMLLNYTANIVSEFKSIGDSFGDVTKHFGLKTTLQIYKAADGSLLGKHTVTGIFYIINGQRSDFTLDQLNMGPIVVDQIPITLTNNTTVNIGMHSLGVSYGKAVIFAFDNLIIPLIDPFASNLQELLTDSINCNAIGADIANYVGIGDPSLYESVCDTALAFAANYVEGKIASLGSDASAFNIAGTCRPYDTNNDSVVDQLVGGQWIGTLTIGPATSTLAAPDQKFVGTRVANP